MTRPFLALVVALLVAACGSSRAENASLTESEAYDRVEAYVRRAVTALPSDARLESAAQPSSVACKGQPSGRVMVTSMYWVRGITGDEHFDTMLRWWQAHDFELLDDLRPERPYMWVKSADGFRMSLRDNEKGELLLSAESPCLVAG